MIINLGNNRCAFFNGKDKTLFGTNVQYCDGSYPQFDGGCKDNQGNFRWCDNAQAAYYACGKNVPCGN
jgi:hypothetical protein